MWMQLPQCLLKFWLCFWFLCANELMMYKRSLQTSILCSHLRCYDCSISLPSVWFLLPLPLPPAPGPPPWTRSPVHDKQSSPVQKGIPMGCGKGSFSHLGTWRVFLSGNRLPLFYTYVYPPNTRLYLCLFFQTKKGWLSPSFQPWPSLLGGQTQGGGSNGWSGSNQLSLSALRATCIFLHLLAFLPATLFLEEGRPLFFQSANTRWAFWAWRSSWWALNSQPPIHRAGRGNGSWKYRARWDGEC